MAWAKYFNEEIVIWRDKLPSKWKSKTLNIASGFYKLSDEKHESEGVFKVVMPEYDEENQELGNIFFDEENNYFTYPVDDIVFDFDELYDAFISAFESVMDMFNALILRCERIQGTENADLNAATAATLQMQSTVMTNVQAIKALNETDPDTALAEMKAFRVRDEDVAYYKAMFEPFKYFKI